MKPGISRPSFLSAAIHSCTSICPLPSVSISLKIAYKESTCFSTLIQSLDMFLVLAQI